MTEHRHAQHRSHRRHPAGFQPQRPLDWSLIAVDLGLFAAIFVLPFVMGGRQAIGEFTLTLIACWTMAAWLLRQTVRGDTPWRLTAMTPLMLLGIGIGLLQLVTLSPDWLARVSPHSADMLSAWSAEATRPLLGGPWTTLSLTPVESQRSLICVIACVMLFVVAVNRLQSLADVRRMMRAIAVAATLMAVFGVLQYLWGNGKFFWFYDYPYTHTRDYAKGGFTNPNHFANYLATAVPLLIAWYATRPAPSTSTGVATQQTGGLREQLLGPFVILCTGCVAIGLLLSQSRGGLLAASGGTLVCLVGLHRARALTGRTAGSLGGIVCVALLSLTLFGERINALVEANFHELASADLSQLDRGNSRQKIWQAALAGIRDYPLFGTGLSSHREVYWTYFDHPEDGSEFSHAENGYLQLTLEAGFCGLAVAATCFLLWMGWCLRGLRACRRPSTAATPEMGALLAASLSVIAVNLAHSVTDFVWYAPGIMASLILLAACAATLHRLATAPRAAENVVSTEHRVDLDFRPGWAVAFVGVLLLSGWMVQQKLPALAAEPEWMNFVRLVREEERLPDDADRTELRLAKYTALLQAARADRWDARIQLQAARAYQAMFELRQRQSDNPMSLLQIQDAALASDWESPAEMQEWLNRPGVLGDNRKYLDTAWRQARHALSLCPLQSEGYLVLGELAWIYTAEPGAEDDLLAQALRARPYDAEAHFVVGRVLSLRGHEAAALDHWKQSFDRSPRFREEIAELLAPVWEARRFVDVFQPDTEALMTVVAAYESAPDQDGHRAMAAQLAQGLCQQAAQHRFGDAARTWRQAHDIYVKIGDVDGATRTAYAALEADPNNVQARRTLGKWLFIQEDYTAALEHLQWCQRRSPHDSEVAGWVHAAIARQSAAQVQQASGTIQGGRRL